MLLPHPREVLLGEMNGVLGISLKRPRYGPMKPQISIITSVHSKRAHGFPDTLRVYVHAWDLESLALPERARANLGAWRCGLTA
jgi:hypothetical protein